MDRSALLLWPKAKGPSFYNQYYHFVFLAFGYGRSARGRQWTRRRKDYLKLALANLEYTLAITDTEYHTPHYSRGKDWGRHIGELVSFIISSCSLGR